MPFKPGQSGNPSGRRFGSRNKRTILADKLFDDGAGALTTAAIKFATEGDPAAMRVCMDRVSPKLRGRPLNFPLPELRTLADAIAAANAIVQGLAQGELSAEEFAALMRAVRDFTLLVAAIDFDRRLTRFEAASAAADAYDGFADEDEEDDEDEVSDEDSADDGGAHVRRALSEVAR